MRLEHLGPREKHQTCLNILNFSLVHPPLAGNGKALFDPRINKIVTKSSLVSLTMHGGPGKTSESGATPASHENNRGTA